MLRQAAHRLLDGGDHDLGPAATWGAVGAATAAVILTVASVTIVGNLGLDALQAILTRLFPS